MNKLILATALALSSAAAFAVPAFAQTAEQAQPSTVPAAQPVSPTQSAANEQHAGHTRSVPPLNSRQCIRDTGSHIPPPKGQCLPVIGNSYSQEDIKRTGATNIGQALQMLDPSVTVRGGGH